MAGSNSDEKGSFRADISQDVIDEALKSVERRMGSEAAPEAEASPEDTTASGDEQAALAEVRRELEEVRAQLELSQAKGREMMERVRESHERALRAAADLENFKKRAQKEKEEVQKYGAERLLKDFLPVLDNLDRAQEAARQSSDIESFRTGVAMTRKLFDDALARHGVKGFSAVGQPFDPHLHEAMQQVETSAVPAGHVVQEFVRGYTLNERLVRPALVVVARAPEPAAEAPAVEAEAATASEEPGATPKGSQ